MRLGFIKNLAYLRNIVVFPKKSYFLSQIHFTKKENNFLENYLNYTLIKLVMRWDYHKNLTYLRNIVAFPNKTVLFVSNILGRKILRLTVIFSYDNCCHITNFFNWDTITHMNIFLLLAILLVIKELLRWLKNKNIWHWYY